MNRHIRAFLYVMVGLFLCQPLAAQSFLQRLDNRLSANYQKGGIDTAYVVRPETKWTVKTRLNVSGAKIETAVRLP